jgi:AraC-like DNA-binding protein
LMESNSDEVRLVLLEEAMARRLAETRRPPPADIAFAARRLRESEGRLAVASLAAEIGCSRKHLTQRFTREFGIAPKLLARVLRFDRAVRMARHGGALDLADLAYSCGYSDQVHLSRDFKEFADAPPAAFLQRLLPDNGGFALQEEARR